MQAYDEKRIVNVERSEGNVIVHIHYRERGERT